MFVLTIYINNCINILFLKLKIKEMYKMKFSKRFKRFRKKQKTVLDIWGADSMKWYSIALRREVSKYKFT